MKKYYYLTLLLFISLNLDGQMVISGHASGDCNCYTITNSIWQAGSIWSPETINLNDPFDFSFELNMGNMDASGADGLLFALRQSGTWTGDLGGYLGYRGIENSIGIEIDTWYNEPETLAGDISSDHVGMHSNGTVSHNLVSAIPISNMEDGENHTFRVIWEPLTYSLEVILDGISIFTYSGDLVTLFFDGNPNVYFGWTGGTGTYHNTQTVCIVSDDFTIELIHNSPSCYGYNDGDLEVVILGTVSDLELIITDVDGNIVNEGNSGTVDNIESGWYYIYVSDTSGCLQTDSVYVNQPDPIFLSEFGFEHSYCRLFGYQNGNGVVFGAASGGTPDYSYQWKNTETGDIEDNTTWGGLNPGNYELTVTDQKGCILTQSLFLDSLNPIADFTVNSDQLNSSCQGTAPIDVVFENNSKNFSQLGSTFGDTTFFWNLNSPINDWEISHDWYETFDTIYYAHGQSYDIKVCLVAFNKNGCSDTTHKIITIYEPIKFEEINIFSPNGDDRNDLFTFNFKSSSIKEFSCVIVDRWGVIVNQLNNISQEWDGTNKNGFKCTNGVYFYSYQAITDNGTILNGQGTIQIVGFY